MGRRGWNHQADEIVRHTVLMSVPQAEGNASMNRTKRATSPATRLCLGDLWGRTSYAILLW